MPAKTDKPKLNVRLSLAMLGFRQLESALRGENNPLKKRMVCDKLGKGQCLVYEQYYDRQRGGAGIDFTKEVVVYRKMICKRNADLCCLNNVQESYLSPSEILEMRGV